MRYVFVFSKGATHKLCDRQIMINDIIEGSALQDEELKIRTFVFQFIGLIYTMQGRGEESKPRLMSLLLFCSCIPYNVFHKQQRSVRRRFLNAAWSGSSNSIAVSVPEYRIDTGQLRNLDI